MKCFQLQQALPGPLSGQACATQAPISTSDRLNLHLTSTPTPLRWLHPVAAPELPASGVESCAIPSASDTKAVGTAAAAAPGPALGSMSDVSFQAALRDAERAAKKQKTCASKCGEAVAVLQQHLQAVQQQVSYDACWYICFDA